MENKAVLQSLFNTSLEHIRKQGKPSRSPDNTYCLYKSPDGSSCAAAPFITVYDPRMDKDVMGFHRLCDNFPDNINKEALENRSFVRMLQKCHDSVGIDGDFMLEYEANMKSLAKDFELEYLPQVER